jgi:hypothetical protein
LNNKILRIMLSPLLAVCAVSATTVIPLSVENLTRLSSHVVEGRATRSWSQWNAAHTVIFTYTEFQVTNTLKGQAPATVAVRQLGGTIDGVTQKVAGVRHWKVGDQSVLFLRPGEIHDGSLVVTGMIQGNFAIYRGASGESLVSNGAPETSAYRVATSEVTDYLGGAMRLNEIESRVQRAVQQ